MGVGGMGHPGWWAGVVAACPGARHRAGGDCTASGRRRSARGGAGRSAVRIRRAELSLVVDDTGLRPRLFVGGGSDVVVAVGWIL